MPGTLPIAGRSIKVKVKEKAAGGPRNNL